ncbi:resistance to lethality of mkk1p386 overexpression [Lecanicillium sp. MT-2017a]|nr:resistance to lethality of mkk1p386 overexpression [Lecanicillium sp. MT-2017a]
MGRRKIEIKAIKDDRNRSVTFLKRKGGLFKKAHELSVLCSVDVAVFIFGNNKKLYEYSSADMHSLISRYQYHGGPNEHKGPNDFSGGADDDDDEDGDITPPRGLEGQDAHMMPPQYHGQQQPPPFSQLRHHTPSASPPVPNGAPYQGHPAHQPPRGHTPQPPMGPRPDSRNDNRRQQHGMVPPPGPHHPSHPGVAYMPAPPIYNPPAGSQQNMMPPQGHQSQYYAPPPQQQQPAHAPYGDDRRPLPPQQYAPAPSHQHMPGPPRPEHAASHQGHPQDPRHPSVQVSAPPPDRHPMDPQPPPPVDQRAEGAERPQVPLLNTDSAIKKLPQRKSHSIFTPIEENRSILSQHLASFSGDQQAIKAEAGNRSQSLDGSGGPGGTRSSGSSPPTQRSHSSLEKPRNPSMPEATFPPPARTNSTAGSVTGGARPRGPRLTVQIPDGGSEPGSATGDSGSPRNPTGTPTQARQRHGSVVLPPPSPSASALLSAGATGPPNPFARPPPQERVNETPVSALPSRFLGGDLLPSPSSFYPDWNFRATDNNTLPSPLNFATPVVGSGPSFLREEQNNPGPAATSSAAPASSTATAGPSSTQTADGSSDGGKTEAVKRKSEASGDTTGGGPTPPMEPKRVKVE